MPSPLSFAACVVYCAVALLCWRALGAARHAGRRNGQAPLWSFLVVLFVLLAVSRLLMLEDYAREVLRGMLEARGAYAGRREWQAMLSAIAIIVLAAAAAWIWRGSRHLNGAPEAVYLFLGKIAALAILGLVALRLISFHAIDGLLYAGPHLNWVIDIGASLVAGYAAWRYRKAQSPS
ncbi:MAG: hypothetical protein EP350_03385 [Alphaproteobacteria bacterium]|nr:MAG: hypothetical protein EP350_03385 [Alphaproteobacteria bacterium]